MFDLFRNIDHALFHFINVTAAGESLDGFMILMSNKSIWIPLYIWLAILLYRKYKTVFWVPLVLIFALVSVSDLLCSKVIKPLAERTRPNHSLGLEVRMPRIQMDVSVRNGSGVVESVHTQKLTDGNGKYGFVSSHAANAFVVFLSFGLLLARTRRQFWFYLIIPVLVSYSRIYLGVHYPADVLGGAVLGMGLAFGGYKILKKSGFLPSYPRRGK
ncbi:MAG: phosphatase PAP2 family protein [Bacteroidetes bacterium]|nr:phosphatase PAP2 family protein [Bacteroidota bacterium]